VEAALYGVKIPSQSKEGGKGLMKASCENQGDVLDCQEQAAPPFKTRSISVLPATPSSSPDSGGGSGMQHIGQPTVTVVESHIRAGMIPRMRC
jgi:hypothetical protein